MTTIYLIRHAEAEGNIYRRIHGQYEGRITPRGSPSLPLVEITSATRGGISPLQCAGRLRSTGQKGRFLRLHAQAWRARSRLLPETTSGPAPPASVAPSAPASASSSVKVRLCPA